MISPGAEKFVATNDLVHYLRDICRYSSLSQIIFNVHKKVQVGKDQEKAQSEKDS